jgi:hypothetical protein
MAKASFAPLGVGGGGGVSVGMDVAVRVTAGTEVGVGVGGLAVAAVVGLGVGVGDVVQEHRQQRTASIRHNQAALVDLLVLLRDVVVGMIGGVTPRRTPDGRSGRHNEPPSCVRAS